MYTLILTEKRLVNVFRCIILYFTIIEKTIMPRLPTNATITLYEKSRQQGEYPLIDGFLN